MSALASSLQAWFTDRLIRERDASPHTIASYRDPIRLLLTYASNQLGVEPSRLDLGQLGAPLVGAFLDYLETDRGCGARTRNTRLAAIRTFYRYCMLRHPEHAATIERVLQIGPKRHERALVTKTITPHVLRHTSAMRLLHADVDTTVIALWLGHEQVDTTQMYLHADLAIKEHALARTKPLNSKPGRYRPPDAILGFLDGCDQVVLHLRTLSRGDGSRCSRRAGGRESQGGALHPGSITRRACCCTANNQRARRCRGSVLGHIAEEVVTVCYTICLADRVTMSYGCPVSAAEAAHVSRIEQRRSRERGIVDAARALFDERGLQDAEMDEIAKAVGINRALIYRHFESKEELFVLTVTRYLDEITELAQVRVDPTCSPEDQLRAAWGTFATYCLEHPAFLDCALSLMRRPARELRLRVSESTWFRLGQSMSACLAVTIEILSRGADQGVFTVADPAFATSCLYTQTLGIMHMARLGVGVSQVAPGVPSLFAVTPEQVHDACIHNALAAVGVVSA